MPPVVFKCIFLGLSCAALAATGCTRPAEPEAASAQTIRRECFLAREANGFTPVGNDRVRVSAGPSRVFELQLTGTCVDVDWANRITLRPRAGGSFVCEGYDAELFVPGPIGVQRCAVTGVRRLSEEEMVEYRQGRRR